MNKLKFYLTNDNYYLIKLILVFIFLTIIYNYLKSIL